MQNPLEQPAPEDKIEQVHAFARDLAFLVSKGLFRSLVEVSNRDTWMRYSFPSMYGDDERYKELDWKLFLEKWSGNTLNNKYPFPSSLASFGYLSYQTQTKEPGYEDDYIFYYSLTDKALALLQAPSVKSTVFISYGHKQSSALALLIEARLKYVDNQIGVFIDKSITPGDEWHAHLQEQVEASQYLVCLLGQSLIQDANGNPQPKPSIDSPYIRQEIQWALQAKKTVIAICHSDYRFPGEQGELDTETWALIETLKTKQGIFVDAESAEEYEFAINKLLNALGYATY